MNFAKACAIIAVSLTVFLVLPSASAQDMEIANKVCSVIFPVWDTLKAAGQALVLLMFVYGGTKYAYSADDPGGRKQGKNICIHAIIGGILISLTSGVLTTLNVKGMCS
jgi:hypothetical protein